MSKHDERPVIEEGSGNVFADFGFPNPEEELLKAQLARQVIMIITRRGLTQVEAATLLGVAQPNISALVNGRLSGFSVDTRDDRKGTIDGLDRFEEKGRIGERRS